MHDVSYRRLFDDTVRGYLTDDDSPLTAEQKAIAQPLIAILGVRSTVRVFREELEARLTELSPRNVTDRLLESCVGGLSPLALTTLSHMTDKIR